MKTIKHIFIAFAFLFSVGTAMAGTDINGTATYGFHALSEVKSTNAQAMAALTDEELGKVEGGVSYIFKRGLVHATPPSKVQEIVGCWKCGVSVIDPGKHQYSGVSYKQLLR